MESDKLQRVSKRADRGVIKCYSCSFFISFPRQISVRKGDVLIDMLVLIYNFYSVSQKTY
jgi:hypothetical protein